jgi:cell division protein FtsQ
MSTRARSRPAPRRRSTQPAPSRPRHRRVSTDPRFRRRRQVVARSRRRKIAMRIGVVVVILLAIWAAFLSPLLRVRAVEVAGADHTTKAEIVDAVGLENNENLLLLSADEVATRVSALPWVKSVEIDRMLPGTVRVRVRERRPALVLSLGAALWTIDSSGRVLSSGEVPGHSLPVLAGVSVGTVAPGVDLRTPEASTALEVWRKLPAPIKSKVEAIFAPTIERVTLSLEEGTQVRYGAAEDMSAKNEVLRALLQRLASEDRIATYIDVRVPSNVVSADAVPDDEDGETAPVAP